MLHGEVELLPACLRAVAAGSAAAAAAEEGGRQAQDFKSWILRAAPLHQKKKKIKDCRPRIRFWVGYP